MDSVTGVSSVYFSLIPNTAFSVIGLYLQLFVLYN